MRILCVGLSHKTAPVALRERLAFDDAGAARALRELRDAWSGAQFALMSTCNRVELYCVRPVHGHPRESELQAWLAEFHRVSAPTVSPYLYTLTDADAVGHLLSVASGLDSLVLGEVQIVSQVKQAYQLASEIGASGPAINELFQGALHTAKHVRSETGIAKGKASVATAAVDHILRTFGSLDGATVLSVGAGKISELMLRELRKLGVGRFLLANRSPENARRLAETCEGEVVAFESIRERLHEADVLVTSTASEAPILTRAMFEESQRRRTGRPQHVVDVAVPRDVDPAAAEVPGLHLYNVDDLEQAVRETLSAREAEVAPARAIIDEHVDELIQALHVRTISPVIDALYKHMESVAGEELADASNKLSARLNGQGRIAADALQRALHRTVRRIMHPVVANLRNSPARETARADAAALERLFELAEDEPDSPS